MILFGLIFILVIQSFVFLNFTYSGGPREYAFAGSEGHGQVQYQGGSSLAGDHALPNPVVLAFHKELESFKMLAATMNKLHTGQTAVSLDPFLALATPLHPGHRVLWH